MNSLIKGLALNYPVKVFATGFIVLVLLSLPLFWIRSGCETSLIEVMPRGARDVSIRPSGLVPPELENDPNVVSHSSVYGGGYTREPLSLGIADYHRMRKPGGSRSNVYFSNGNWMMYFDKKSGQIVHQYLDIQVLPDKTRKRKIVQLYIGHEGISETTDKALGRFVEPIIDHGWITREPILYDKKLRRFFKIDFNQRTVIKGPELKKDDPHKPIQIGQLNKSPFLLSLSWQPPKIKATDGSPKPIIQTGYERDAGPYLLVLDETGRIDLLDKEALEFAGTAGWLPAPQTHFPSKPSVTPRDLLGYKVWPLALTTQFFENPEEVRVAFGDPSYSPARLPSRVERKYLGMFAASLSRNGTAMALAVFDDKGKKIKREDTKAMVYIQDSVGSRPRNIPSSKAFFFQAPWAYSLTIGKFLAENLHPPLLSVASYFTASAFEAASGHRALFFLPNSFIAMKARDYRGNFAERFMSALWLILPSIILAIWLACRVGKNAAVVGLSENARLYWIIVTLAFGLTAYITYRLTQPKITLVTCPNCGKMRRPDMPKCHRCGSKWHVPELIPPAWRVLEWKEQVDYSSKVDAAETVAE